MTKNCFLLIFTSQRNKKHLLSGIYIMTLYVWNDSQQAYESQAHITTAVSKIGHELLQSSQEPHTGKTHYNCSLEDKINTLPNVKVLLNFGTQTRNKPGLTQDSICVSVQMPTPKLNWKAQ